MRKRKTLDVGEFNYDLTGVLDRGSEFEGTLSFEGTFRIGGVFRGHIYTNDILIIGEGARVEAEVEAGTLVINGEFVGNIKATSRVEIHQPAVFKGNIQSPSLMVDDGVVFEGTSQMTGGSGSAPSEFV